VDNFADEAKPIYRSNLKDRPFIFGAEQQKAFESLKDKFCKAPVLAFPDFGLPFVLTTDASKAAVAAILSQIKNGVERSISLASRQLNNAERTYSASECAMLALVWATKKFRCYLFGKQFLARTDHFALTYLRNIADNNSRLMRWALRLSEFDFIIEHKPGTRIRHADALSRHVGVVLEDGL